MSEPELCGTCGNRVEKHGVMRVDDKLHHICPDLDGATGGSEVEQSGKRVQKRNALREMIADEENDPALKRAAKRTLDELD